MLDMLVTQLVGGTLKYSFAVLRRLERLLGVILLLDDRRWLHDLLSEDISLDEIRKPHSRLVGNVVLRWNREDLCERRQYEAE